MTSPSPTGTQFRDAYADLQVRLCQLLSTADDSAVVPSCPGWTVHDVLAHLVGLCEDWIDHRLSGYASTSWTTQQVVRYEGCNVGELLRHWTDLLPHFTRLDDDPRMGPPARWAFGDGVIHEADVRHALSAGRPPHDAVALSLKGSIARWRATLEHADSPRTLIVRPPDAREWTLGTPSTDAPIIVSPPAYELFRGLAGRRTREQVCAWPWSTNPDPILNLGLPYPFQWASTPITD